MLKKWASRTKSHLKGFVTHWKHNVFKQSKWKPTAPTPDLTFQIQASLQTCQEQAFRNMSPLMQTLTRKCALTQRSSPECPCLPPWNQPVRHIHTITQNQANPTLNEEAQQSSKLSGSPLRPSSPRSHNEVFKAARRAVFKITLSRNLPHKSINTSTQEAVVESTQVLGQCGYTLNLRSV